MEIRLQSQYYSPEFFCIAIEFEFYYLVESYLNDLIIHIYRVYWL